MTKKRKKRRRRTGREDIEREEKLITEIKRMEGRDRKLKKGRDKKCKRGINLRNNRKS